MAILANLVADPANPKFREDVLARKLAIARGKGTVHGALYDLDAIGITLKTSICRNNVDVESASQLPGAPRADLTRGICAQRVPMRGVMQTREADPATPRF
jgi:hypothetical protein